MSYETYHIPVNFTDAGKLFGVFEIRNAVETVLLCIPILFLCLVLLPLTLMPKIIVTMAILVPVGGSHSLASEVTASRDGSRRGYNGASTGA